jgi:hypothetical protein
MNHLDLVLWLLFYPLCAHIGDYFFLKNLRSLNIPTEKFDEKSTHFTYVIMFLFYIGVAVYVS